MVPVLTLPAMLQEGGVAVGQAAGDLEVLLRQARSSLRHGLLEQVERQLEDVEARGSELQRAHALLLLGNVAYDRGDYGAAAGRYVGAAEGFRRAAQTEPEAAEPGLAAAEANRALAEEQLARGAELAAAARRLRGLTMGAVAAAVAVIAWLGWRSRERVAAGSRQPRASGASQGARV
jgi:hypothetical protein